MNDCIFCKIEKNEIPSERVYEDDGYIAFLDINPISFGHTLVIPRGHHSNIDETPDGVLAGMIALAKKIGLAVVASLGADAYNIHINNGRASGQLVDHVHLHIIPRTLDDGLKAWRGRGSYPEGEMSATADKIKTELDKNLPR